MVIRARHYGIVVKNIKNSLQLYRGILGFKVWRRQNEKGKYIENVVGLKGAVLEWIKLKDKKGFLIELIQYKFPMSKSKKFFLVNCPGTAHIALTVKDLETLYNKLTKKGYKCNSMPQLSPDGKAKVLYFRDKDGAVLELVEEL
ncbi:VOC family protein [Elusimicrobiota bacterium]